MKIVTFKASEDLIKEMDRVAAELGVTRSHLIRMAVQRFMREYREQEDAYIRSTGREKIIVKTVYIP